VDLDPATKLPEPLELLTELGLPNIMKFGEEVYKEERREMYLAELTKGGNPQC
jgi:hypothetical protein